MSKWIKVMTKAVILIIGILLPLAFGVAAYYSFVSMDTPNDTTTVVVDPNFIDTVQQMKNDMLLKALEETKSEPNFTDIVSQSVKSVVHIRCPQWQGSGFVIDKNIICTARHVVEDVEDFDITFSDGKKICVTRAISDKEHDVGFIWVEEDMNDIVKIGSIKDCKLGQDIFIIGSPYGGVNFNSVSKGIISGLNRDWDEINYRTGERYGWEISFTSDSAAHPGNSGGAVFTLDGVVRGILVGGYSPVLNCSMPCDLFLSDIEQIRLMFLMDKYEFEKESVYSEDKYYKDSLLDVIGNTIDDIIGLIPGIK